MEQTLKELPTALATFQSKHHAAGRDSKGNYGTYTSLASALAAVQPACEQGLSHSQTLHPLGEDMMVLRTTLFHNSGESIYSDLPISLKPEGGRGNHYQAMGSALTYCRRYSLLAIYGLASEDDEGESAAQPAAKAAAKAAPAKPLRAAPAPTPAEPQQPSKDSGPNQIEWIDEARKEHIIGILRKSDRKDEILEAFKAKFQLAVPKVGLSHVQLPAHGDFLEAELGIANAA